MMQRAMRSVTPILLGLLTSGIMAGCGPTIAEVRPPAWPALRWTPNHGALGLEELEAAAREGRASAAELALLGSLEELLGRPTAALGHLVGAVQRGREGAGDGSLRAAESAAAQLGVLEDRAAGWDDAVIALAAGQADRATSPLLTRLLGAAAMRARLRHGDDSEIGEARRAAGCVTRWRAVGPFGPRALLSFDRADPPATDSGPWRETYDLGAGRGEHPVFDPLVRGCEVELAAPAPSWGGTTYAATHVELERPTDVVLALDTPSSARIWINGALVLENDRRRAYLPAVAERRVRLPAGTSRIVVALTSRFPAPIMALTFTDSAGRSLVDRVVAPPDGERVAGEPEALETPPRGDPPTAAARLLEAHVAFESGDAERLRRLIEGDETLADSAPGLVLRAMSWSIDRSVPFDVARNRVLTLLRQADELEPATWRPDYELARYDAEEERYDEALARLRRAVESSPEQPALWLLLASLLTSRALWAQSLEAIDRAAELAPGSCEPERARLALARGRERQADADTAARRLSACDRSDDALAMAHLRAGRWVPARVELQRLIGRLGERTLLLAALADAFRGLGEATEEAAVHARILARDPEDRRALLDLVDLTIAQGRREEALEILRGNIERLPADNLAERRMLALLQGDELLSSFRIDGREVIERFEASGRSYEQPSVLVLDRTVFRVFEDGSIVELTHNITRVQSAEGIELEGEFAVPRGAALLAIRTIKPDGTVLEPEDIEGKDSLSLPGLEVGDYIEIEYLRGHEPPPEFPGGVWPWRFYFQGSRRAFHHSELVVAAPPGRAFDLSWRGAPLAEERSTVNGLVVRRWVAREMGTLTNEPDGPSREEVVPSLQVSAGASWEAYREALAEALVDRDRPSRALEQRARAIVADAGASTPDEQLDALFRWVAQNIEPGGDPLAPVSHIFAARTGQRTRLLAALARAVGIEPALGFARSSHGDQTDDPIPSLDIYGYIVARFGSRWVYVGDRARWAPACSLPADLRGQRVLMQEGALFSQITAEPCHPDATTVRLQLTLSPDGTAAGRLEEQFSGGPALRWRALLARTPDDERQGAVEEDHLADVLPGVEVTSFEIADEEALDRPLRIRYEVRGLRLGEVRDGALRLALPYRSELAATWAPLPTRTTPVVIHEPIDETVRVEIALPPGASAAPIERAEAIVPNGSFRRAPVTDAPAGTLTFERRLTLRPARVEPAAYGAFSAFCRDVDRIEQEPITVTLP